MTQNCPPPPATTKKSTNGTNASLNMKNIFYLGLFLAVAGISYFLSNLKNIAPVAVLTEQELLQKIREHMVLNVQEYGQLAKLACGGKSEFEGLFYGYKGEIKTDFDVVILDDDQQKISDMMRRFAETGIEFEHHFTSKSLFEWLENSGKDISKILFVIDHSLGGGEYGTSVVEKLISMGVNPENISPNSGWLGTKALKDAGAQGPKIDCE